jgi:hypothetical protein
LLLAVATPASGFICWIQIRANGDLFVAEASCWKHKITVKHFFQGANNRSSPAYKTMAMIRSISLIIATAVQTWLLRVTSNYTCPFAAFHGLVNLQLIGMLRLEGSLWIGSAHLSLCCYWPVLGGLGIEKASVCATATVSRLLEFLLALNQDGL